jgi:secretion/DNA translocation related TadE-like protein
MTRPDERGAATVFAVACLAVLLLVGSALGVVAAMVRAHRAAQSAADLAALAAASALVRGRDPCGSAAAITVANGAELVACDIQRRDVVVAVEVAGPRWLGQTGDLTAQARAGPAGVTCCGSGQPGAAPDP